ncbi:ead/Ea22-like family protein [Enterobacter hormaechei]|uniref:ead/Ea22-like family protein n=1 Tax=Enterobacter hormaechei TaxID=158836 RepID=UPI002873F72A|nr:ead/Ea22-like family protein [Enterobacter hormaechei]MDR9887182.1 ead/Ea22-like family protein [Enterobacter hormaechei subsp. xiangfangensis]
MSNIDKKSLRDSAESTINILENIAGFEPSDIDGDTVELRFENEDGFDTGCDVSIVDQCQKAADVVRALLDELEAKDRRIAELSHHLQSAHGFIEHTEAFGHEASNGILCCGDAQWNIDESKSALAAAGKGE